MCVVHACHPMRSIERTIRIPSRRHREVEAGSTGNARMEFEIGCVSIAQYSYFLRKQSFYVKFIHRFFSFMHHRGACSNHAMCET